MNSEGCERRGERTKRKEKEEVREVKERIQWQAVATKNDMCQEDYGINEICCLYIMIKIDATNTDKMK